MEKVKYSGFRFIFSLNSSKRIISGFFKVIFTRIQSLKCITIFYTSIAFHKKNKKQQFLNKLFNIFFVLCKNDLGSLYLKICP